MVPMFRHMVRINLSTQMLFLPVLTFFLFTVMVHSKFPCSLSSLHLLIFTLWCNLTPFPESPLSKVIIYPHIVKFCNSLHASLLWPHCGVWHCCPLPSENAPLVLVTPRMPSWSPPSRISFLKSRLFQWLPQWCCHHRFRAWFSVLCSSVHIYSQWPPCLSLHSLSVTA